MKRFFVSTSIFFVVVAIAFAASQFEGKMTYEIDAKGRKSDLTFYVKDKMTKLEMTMEKRNIKMIMDWDKNKNLMIMDEQKMVMAMPLEVPDRMKEQTDMKGAKPVNTGKTKNILGYECELWTIKNDDRSIEIWNAKGLGTFQPFAGTMARRNMNGFPDISAFMDKGDLFPLEVISKDASGKENFHMTAKSIEKKSLLASIFEVPSDYKMMDMGARIKAEDR